MSTSNVVHWRGKAIPFDVVEVEPGVSACAGCMGSAHDEVCDELPDTCRTHHVIFKEAA